MWSSGNSCYLFLALAVTQRFAETLTAVLSLQAHSRQFLHKIRSHTFPDQHLLPPQRPAPQIASVSWSSDIWDQQILTELTERWIISTAVDLLTSGGSQKLTRTDCPVRLNCAVDKVCAAFKECRGAAVVSWKVFFLKSITFQKCYLKPESFKEGRFGCTASEGQSCGFPVFTLVAHLYNCPVDTINVNLFPCIQTP